MLSGKPSRSRGPGSSSRKKSASWASNERKPFGTILTASGSEKGVAGGLGIDVEGGPGEGRLIAAILVPLADFSSAVDSFTKCRRSSAMSLAVVYRSEARFD